MSAKRKPAKVKKPEAPSIFLYLESPYDSPPIPTGDDVASTTEELWDSVGASDDDDPMYAAEYRLHRVVKVERQSNFKVTTVE